MQPEKYGESGENSDANQDPQKVALQAEPVRQGAFKGITNLQNPILNAGKKQTDNLGAESGEITGQSSGDNIAVIETKKRRTSEDSDTNEQNKDIIMGTENDILTVINEDTFNNIIDSKNGFVAGTHVSARQSL